MDTTRVSPPALKRPLTVEFREGFLPEWTDMIMEIHNKTQMKRDASFRRQVREGFMGSFAVVTAWTNNRLIACGRLISDGNMYSSLFDLVVDPEFQKQGIGTEIVSRLMSKAPGTCVHLTSTFGNEEFYERLGFKRHRTAMAYYPNAMASSPYLESAPLAKELVEQPRLDTQRLRLEPYVDSDLDDIFAYGSSPEVAKYLLWEAHQTTEDSKQFLHFVRNNTRHERGNLFFVFAIREKATGRVIGSIDFKNPRPFTGQIDYALGVPHWRKGYMTEAASAVMAWALNAFPELERIQSFCHTDNVASARVMLKLGMRFEGVQRKSMKVKNAVVDIAHYAWTR